MSNDKLYRIEKRKNIVKKYFNSVKYLYLKYSFAGKNNRKIALPFFPNLKSIDFKDVKIEDKILPNENWEKQLSTLEEMDFYGSIMITKPMINLFSLTLKTDMSNFSKNFYNFKMSDFPNLKILNIEYNDAIDMNFFKNASKSLEELSLIIDEKKYKNSVIDHFENLKMLNIHFKNDDYGYDYEGDNDKKKETSSLSNDFFNFEIQPGMKKNRKKKIIDLSKMKKLVDITISPTFKLFKSDKMSKMTSFAPNKYSEGVGTNTNSMSQFFN